MKVLLGTLAGVAAAGAVFIAVRSFGTYSVFYSIVWPSSRGTLTRFCRAAPPPPKSISKEWEEASNERALEQKMNPISGIYLPNSLKTHVDVELGFFTGISSEGYSGTGFVTHK